jgi:hypothetical protein
VKAGLCSGGHTDFLLRGQQQRGINSCPGGESTRDIKPQCHTDFFVIGTQNRPKNAEGGPTNLRTHALTCLAGPFFLHSDHATHERRVSGIGQGDQHGSLWAKMALGIQGGPLADLGGICEVPPTPNFAGVSCLHTPTHTTQSSPCMEPRRPVHVTVWTGTVTVTSARACPAPGMGFHSPWGPITLAFFPVLVTGFMQN